MADRAERSHVLKLALPALLVAAFILASTPAAEAHNTWNGGYRKWPWRGSDDRTLTTLPGECPHCPGVETSSASKAIDVAMNYETVYSIAPGTISIYSTTGGKAGIYVQVKDVDGSYITYEHLSKAIVKSGSVIAGQPIAVSGCSGNCGAPHLHFQRQDGTSFYANALLGDPVVTCSSATHFQYASILNTLASDGISPLIGPSISFSTNGGKTWSEPQQVVSLDGSTEIADKPSMAVDPADPHHMYLTYTHLSALACTNIEIVRSTDGGRTWSAPTTINPDCNNPNIVMDTGSSVVVAPGGRIYVAYESFPLPSGGTSFGKTAIYVARSLDGGATFGKPVKVSDVMPGGDGVYLNGPLQANDYPQVAVDRSNHSSRGTVYITWPDGRNHVVPDRSAPSGTYAYADVFVAKSTNFGSSFKVLGAISPTPTDFRGLGRDQFLPAIAVDNDAEVAVCYYDRRNDRANLRVDRFCSISDNLGKTWKDLEVSVLNWLPTPNKDPLSGGFTHVISEYDGLTSEFLLHSDGFFGAFVIELSGNQNVVATKF